MTISYKSWWDRLRFRDKGILPTPRLIISFAAFSGFLLLLSLLGIVPWLGVAVANLLFIMLSLVDLLFSPRPRQLQMERSMEQRLERGRAYSIELKLCNRSGHHGDYQIIDDLPDSFVRPFPLCGHMGPQQEVIIRYETAANVRGDYEITRVYVRYSGLFSLWQKQTAVVLRQEVQVIPDLAETRRYLENAQKYLLYEGTTLRRQQSGFGEFSKIRSYAVGDDPRKINWMQTAKLMEVMTNEYEPEHGKYVTLLIDCGRRMGAELKHGNRLEKALEACLTVAAAALQKGDYVAVLAFSSQIKAYVPPQKGMAHLQTILQAIYALQVDEVEPNVAAVLQELEKKQKKRSLLLLFSDVHSFLMEDSSLVYLQRLRRRHLFMLIGIIDQTLQARIQEAPHQAKAAMVKAMAQQQWLRHRRQKKRWEQQGLLLAEAEEEGLAAEAVSRYIELINRGLL